MSLLGRRSDGGEIHVSLTAEGTSTGPVESPLHEDVRGGLGSVGQSLVGCERLDCFVGFPEGVLDPFGVRATVGQRFSELADIGDGFALQLRSVGDLLGLGAPGLGGGKDDGCECESY